ncbi:MAG TPA: tRNA uridine-5-carboxymethylaminomethyl(34) synthesis enzyme MnmG, partial [Thermoanaerobaculia bacterium]|nr:tRNA uridine-5-carboxymethylaminomethyl(34) synthesis enzyme MnmG [Thermoanaerobaculia bacterium]
PLTPDRPTTAWLREAGIELAAPTTIARLSQRPEFDLGRIAAAAPDAELAEAFRALSEEEGEGLVSGMRYAGYIERQQREAAKIGQDEDLRIPATMTYALPGLSREMTEKLSAIRPHSLGQASRIPGVTPAAIAILRMHVRRGTAAVSS